MHQYKQYRTQSSTYKTTYADICETTVPYLYINRLPEDEPSRSKHVEDIKIKNLNIHLENVHFVGVCCIVRIDLKEIGWGGDWIDLAQDRNKWHNVVHSAAMNFRVA